MPELQEVIRETKKFVIKELYVGGVFLLHYRPSH